MGDAAPNRMQHGNMNVVYQYRQSAVLFDYEAVVVRLVGLDATHVELYSGPHFKTLEIKTPEINSTGNPMAFRVRCRANMAHTRQSRPDSGLEFQVKVLKT